MLLDEIYNPRVFSRGFEKEQDHGRYRLVAKHGQLPWLGHGKVPMTSDQFRIEAYLGRNMVGWVNFEVVDDHLEAIDVVVDKKHRRRGIATAMYKFAKSLGNDISASSKQTGLGREFWATKSPVAEGQEESIDRDLLDNILVRLCDMVIHGQQSPEDMGWVAAAVLDPNNNCVAAVNYGLPSGKRVHGERAAIDAYLRRFGDIPAGSTVITTLSPCSEDMEERYNESCTDLLEQHGIKKVYAGYQDPTQDSNSNVIITDNPQIQELCQKFAETFLPTKLDELSFLGSQCTKDCSGHRAGYKWYKQNGRQPTSWSPSFNKGAALAQAGK